MLNGSEGTVLQENEENEKKMKFCFSFNLRFENGNHKSTPLYQYSCCNPPTDLCMEMLRNSMLESNVISHND